MTVLELRDFYKVKNNTELANILNRSRSTIFNWQQNGIPLGVQAQLQLHTNGRLKANFNQ